MAESTAGISGILKFKSGEFKKDEDILASEEPLEIRLNGKAVSVTMRTPGEDKDLAAGFLFTEGILKGDTGISSFIELPNQIDLLVDPLHLPELKSLERNFYTSSSCGVCGKASIDAIRTVSQYRDEPSEFKVKADILLKLPSILREKQAIFEKTGGLHASALFDKEGRFLELREDVGRHNALDKLIGSAFLQKQLPLSSHILLLSGRASFELVQKAAMAGIKIIAAVGAPSSLAVETARDFNISLAGFLRDERFNLYSGTGRISTS